MERLCDERWSSLSKLCGLFGDHERDSDSFLQWKSLRELLTYLKLENLNAIFVLAPYELESEVKQENFNYCESIIQEYGYEFLNMNESLDQMNLIFLKIFMMAESIPMQLVPEKCSNFFAEYMINHYDFNDNVAWKAMNPGKWHISYGKVSFQRRRIQSQKQLGQNNIQKSKKKSKNSEE